MKVNIFFGLFPNKKIILPQATTQAIRYYGFVQRNALIDNQIKPYLEIDIFSHTNETIKFLFCQYCN